jgi:hypothetical protein
MRYLAEACGDRFSARLTGQRNPRSHGALRIALLLAVEFVTARVDDRSQLEVLHIRCFALCCVGLFICLFFARSLRFNSSGSGTDDANDVMFFRLLVTLVYV